jgi:hypothetical protein
MNDLGRGHAARVHERPCYKSEDPAKPSTSYRDQRIQPCGYGAFEWGLLDTLSPPTSVPGSTKMNGHERVKLWADDRIHFMFSTVFRYPE